MGVNQARPLVVMSRDEHYTKSLRERFSRSFADFGLEHGLGWLGIIHTLHYRLAHLNPAYTIHQIKEKFGILRFYCSAEDIETTREEAEEIRRIISDAEQQTGVTCEICGAPGAVGSENYWLRCRCDECRAKENESTSPDKA